jgi:hypothetical protein
MVKMVSLKKSKVDRDVEKNALSSSPGGIASPPSEHEGVHVNLDHHHLKNLGVEKGMKAGDKVDFHGRGTVKSYETHDDKGGAKSSAILHFDKGAIEHDADRDEERDDLKSEIVKNVGKMQKEAETK